jgi:hypothetical protein
MFLQAVVNHSWQPQTQHLHILVAPLLVFTAGLVWRRHVWAQWKRGMEERRRSGLSLVSLLVHTGLWLLGYLAHQAMVTGG